MIARLFLSAILCLGFGVAVSQDAAADEVSDLRAENEALSDELQRLRNEVAEIKAMIMQEKISPAAGGSSAAPAVKSGSDKVSLKVSGQVNRLVLFADDGDQSRFFQADNDESSTRIRFQGNVDLESGWSAGTNIEVQMESNSTSDVTIDQNKSVIGSNSFTERKLEVFFKNKDLGKLSLGQGDTASNGVTEVDLSGTSVISQVDSAVLASSIAFVVSGTNGTSSGTAVGDIFDNLDGLSRDDRIRYDTPSFAGATLSTSWVDGDEYDIGFRYGREFDGFEVALALAYWDATTTDDKTGYGGSASVLAPFGTNLTFSYAREDLDLVAAPNAQADIEPEYWYAKLGQQFKMTSLGKTSVSIDYMSSEDQSANGNEGESYSLGIVQKVDAIGTEIYGTVRQWDADIPAVETENVTIGAAGARIKF